MRADLQELIGRREHAYRFAGQHRRNRRPPELLFPAPIEAIADRRPVQIDVAAFAAHEADGVPEREVDLAIGRSRMHAPAIPFEQLDSFAKTLARNEDVEV